MNYYQPRFTMFIVYNFYCLCLQISSFLGMEVLKFNTLKCIVISVVIRVSCNDFTFLCFPQNLSFYPSSSQNCRYFGGWIISYDQSELKWSSLYIIAHTSLCNVLLHPDTINRSLLLFKYMRVYNFIWTFSHLCWHKFERSFLEIWRSQIKL